MAGITVDIGATTSRLTRGLGRGRSEISKWARSVVMKLSRAGIHAGAAFVRGMVRHLRRAGLVAGGLLAAGIGKSLSEAGRFEYYEFQFKSLMRSAEKAKARMDEIRQLDLEVPFDISQLADASRSLEVFTGGAEAGAEALRMLADAAAVTPRGIQEVAYWYGRAYAAIKSGRPLGEANRRLLEMGIIGPEATQWLQMLSKNYSIESQALKLEIIKKEMRKFEGAASDLTKTWKGTLSVFGSGVKQTFEKVGLAIQPLAQKWLNEVIEKMQELRDNGTLTRWGEVVSLQAERVRKIIETRLIPVLETLKTKSVAYWKEIVSEYESGGLGAVIEKSTSDGIKMAVAKIIEYAPTFAAVGFEIGKALANGIAKGLRDNSWFGRRFGEVLDFADGATFGNAPGSDLWERAAAERFSERQAAKARVKNQEEVLGRMIARAMNQNENSLSSKNLRRLGQRAATDHAWARGILQVSIVEDHTKNEEVP
jgi:hypothetical protein